MMRGRRVSRRVVLGATACSVLTAGSSGALAASAQGAGLAAGGGVSPATGLVVTLAGLPTAEVAGGKLVFSQENAKDMGDYVGAFVHQKCYLQSQGFFNVFFRPDADGTRNEVVIERFKWPLDRGDVPTHLIQVPAQGDYIAYTVTITQGASTLATIPVRCHFWGARWRWQSAPRPIVRAPADIRAAKMVMPLKKEYGYGLTRAITEVMGPPQQRRPSSPFWTGPMGTAGMMGLMREGGPRPELGLVTEYNADVLLFNDDLTPHAQAATLAQAEAVGSFPIWWRDRRTGAIADCYGNGKGFSWIGDGSRAPQFPLTWGDPNTKKAGYPSNDIYFCFQMDLAHLPNPAWFAWCQTDDPYFYEGAEVCAHFSYFYSYFGYRGPGNYKYYDLYMQKNGDREGANSQGQVRGYAWGLRDVARMYAFAPENAPSWLFPKSHWARVLNANLAIAQISSVHATSKINTIFRQLGGNIGSSHFELCYLALVLGWMVWSGKFGPEWKDVLKFMAPSVLGWVDGRSGWDRRWPCAYLQWWEGMKPNADHPYGEYFVGQGTLPDGKEIAFDYTTGYPYWGNTKYTWDDLCPDSWAQAFSLMPKWYMHYEPASTLNGGTKIQLDPSSWTVPNRLYINGVDTGATYAGGPGSSEYLLNTRCAVSAIALALGSEPIPTLYDGVKPGTTDAAAAAAWLHGDGTHDDKLNPGRKLSMIKETINSFAFVGGADPWNYNNTDWATGMFDWGWAVPPSWP